MQGSGLGLQLLQGSHVQLGARSISTQRTKAPQPIVAFEAADPPRPQMLSPPRPRSTREGAMRLIRALRRESATFAAGLQLDAARRRQQIFGVVEKRRA